MFRSPRGRAVRSSFDNKNESDGRLHRAVVDRDQDTVKELIQEHGYDIDEADKGGETPLLLALRLKHEQMALLLLECGADPSKANVEILKQFKDKSKTKNQSPEDSEPMVVTPEALALNLGLKTVHAAILEAKARKHLTEEMRIIHAALIQASGKSHHDLHHHRHPSFRRNASTVRVVDTTARESSPTKQRKIRKDKSERAVVSQTSLRISETNPLLLDEFESPRSVDAVAPTSSTASPAPQIRPSSTDVNASSSSSGKASSGKSSLSRTATEIHAMTPRRSSMSGKRRSSMSSGASVISTTPTSAGSMAGGGEGGRSFLCEGIGCPIM